MINPDIVVCPCCDTHKLDLELKPRIVVTDWGEREFKGKFKTCSCGAFTYSPQNQQYNFRSALVEEHGVKKRDPNRVTKAVPPVIRKKRDD